MISTKKLAAAALALTAAGGAGVAYAAWTSPSGSGSAYAKSQSAAAVNTAGASTNAFTGETLYPGATGKKVYAVVTNTNPYPVLLDFSAGTGSIAVASGGDAACNATTGVTYSPATAVAVPANQTTPLEVVAGSASMSNASLTSCQGQTFVIPVNIAATSNAA